MKDLDFSCLLPRKGKATPRDRDWPKYSGSYMYIVVHINVAVTHTVAKLAIGSIQLQVTNFILATNLCKE